MTTLPRTRSVAVRSGGADFELVLPLDSTDPVVGAYLRGEPLNDYLLELLSRVLPAAGTVLDLGCHVGTFSIGAAALGHRVVSVDASPRHVELVQASAEVNELRTVTVLNAAVSDRPGTVRFHEDGLFGSVDNSGEAEVSAMTVPALLAQADLELDDVDFVKMDVEGSELRALTGAASALVEPDAPPIAYESNPMTSASFGYSVDGIRTALEALGYHTYQSVGDDLRLCPPEQPQPEAWVDLIALKPGHIAERDLEVRGPVGDDHLMARFEEWSRVPHPNVRAHVATELASNWERLGGNRSSKAILRRLAGDRDKEVRDAVRDASPPSNALAGRLRIPRRRRPLLDSVALAWRRVANGGSREP
jgi:FkbM family methyltransferase